MIREVKFESQDRREKQILAALNANHSVSASRTPSGLML